jgi:SAM-dependent methyltransferase
VHDRSGELEIWKRVLTPEFAVLREQAAGDHESPAAVARLRRLAGADEVRVAIELARARAKAQVKFGPAGASLVADVPGVEMASSPLAAAHKARRFAALARSGPVLDLCCGIGGDAIEFARAGLAVTPVDLDPVRAWMAERNTGRPAVVGDAGDSNLPDGPFHIDPQRRTGDGSRRLHAFADLAPGPDVLREIIRRREASGGGCIKLGPGVALADLPPGEVEILSERGTLTQAVLWTGLLAGSTSRRRATLLPAGATLASDGPAGVPPAAPLARFIFELDDAVERADLLAEACEHLGAPMLHPRLGLLTGDAPIDSPWVRGFEVLASDAWNEKRAAAALAALGAGVVEVKTRGKVVDPDALQPRLSGRGATPLVLFVLRFDRELRSIIARRIDGSGGRSGSVLGAAKPPAP